MAKLKISCYFFLLLFLLSCKQESTVSIKIIKFENNRLYYKMKNETNKNIKIFVSESPNIFINNKILFQNERQDSIINPFTINFLEDSMRVSVNVFSNEKYSNQFNQYPLRIENLFPNKTFESYLYLDTTGAYLKYAPVLKKEGNMIEIIYNGNELIKRFQIKNSDYEKNTIISENKLLINKL
ncbi:hypothetical protein [Epilithonimonas caeni]|uniref:hypothetical protein n=1 Tax=Epilithonimonas caeni TaxID=365343 RepID=UPI000424924A|nr:hypothetical protein [Epilithonimonas caeni]